MNQAHAQHLALVEQLNQVRQGQVSIAALCASAWQSQDLLAALPQRYPTVLQELLNRLESSALFSEESCSFSQVDLLDSLQLWLQKAEQQLAAT